MCECACVRAYECACMSVHVRVLHDCVCVHVSVREYVSVRVSMHV